MTSDPIIKDAAEGATKGLLNWTKEQISDFANKIINKDIAFVQDRELIELIKEQKQSPAYDFYKRYVNAKDYRNLVNLGLTLRKLDKNKDKLEKFRSKIYDAYGTRGLHICEFVASNILSKFIATRIDAARSNQDITNEVETIFKNIDKDYRFVKNGDNPKIKSKELIFYLNGSLPEIVILVSKGNAQRICKEIIKFITKQIDSSYKMDSISEVGEFVVFIKRKE